jgi:hypothetical protein
MGSFLVGQIAEHLSFSWAFAITGVILTVAALGWVAAPETRVPSQPEHTPTRPLGPEVGGEVP